MFTSRACSRVKRGADDLPCGAAVAAGRGGGAAAATVPGAGFAWRSGSVRVVSFAAAEVSKMEMEAVEAMEGDRCALVPLVGEGWTGERADCG